MNISAAIADPLLRHALGQQVRSSDPQRTARARLKAPRAGLTTRFSDFVTTRHE